METISAAANFAPLRFRTHARVSISSEQGANLDSNFGNDTPYSTKFAVVKKISSK